MQLEDGVVFARDLTMGPELGDGAYGAPRPRARLACPCATRRAPNCTLSPCMACSTRRPAGVVTLARHKLFQDQWYAVKRISKQRLSEPQHLQHMERERELLMLLARESRGSRGREMVVRLVTSVDDPYSMQLVMPAVLGGELFHLLQEYPASGLERWTSRVTRREGPLLLTPLGPVSGQLRQAERASRAVLRRMRACHGYSN